MFCPYNLTVVKVEKNHIDANNVKEAFFMQMNEMVAS